MEHILELIRQNGDLFYLITFIWTALEGETFVIFAGLAAQRGLINLYLLFLCAALGSMLGDQIFFFIGRFFGRKIIEKKPKLQPKLEKVFAALDKYAIAFILSYRFMYGVRNVSAFAIGTSPMAWKRFAFWNAVASLLWSAVFCGGGYLFGIVLEKMGLTVEDSAGFDIRTLTIAVLVIFIFVIGTRVWSKKRNAKHTKDSKENQ